MATLQVIGELDQAAMMRCALTVRPRFRGITVISLGCAIAFMFLSSLLLPMAQRTAAVLLACTFAIYLLYVLRQELRLVSGFRVALAEVSARRHFVPSEGFDSLIEYSFAAENGREYRGRSRGVQRRLPPPKWLVPVAYNPEAPEENQPFATFWFFHFDYDGTEQL